jgi:hypothetical protein
MTRCAIPSPRPPGRRLLLAGLGLLLTLGASAQELVQRRFPADALRGTLRVVDPPDVLLNGLAWRLAPGSRIRGTDNLLAMSAALVDGQTRPVHYTLDTLGQIREVWLLRSDELQRFWPATPAEAALLDFDPVAQTWTRKP